MKMFPIKKAQSAKYGNREKRNWLRSNSVLLGPSEGEDSNEELTELLDVDQSSDDDDDEAYFAYPVQLLPPRLQELDFFKNADNKLQEELLKTTQLVYIKEDGKGMVPKLREPRTLYAMTSMMGPQQAARWPSDIQVINKKITHIRYIPPEPEPFYKSTGFEKMPMVRGEERGGRLVYMYEPRSTFFVRSRVGGIRTGPDRVAVELDKTIDDKTLIFEARFESGNLAKAVQVGDYDYELWLRYDLYTKKHTQWFYFAVSNTRPNVTYRFSIVNFIKPDSLYNFGMKPLMYSEKDALQKKIGWHRCGNNIKYYKNNMVYETSRGEKSFYSMTWNVEFPHNHDTVYFAHCYPYTYTDLQDYLLDLSNDPVKSKICKQRVLCRTLAGNLVYVLTITSPSQNADDLKHKKAVVVTSRVHPGESNASWMMKGFLDYLTGSSADAKLLRDTFIFKIVPMLNPDGVVVGNYRCSLAGRDLNRNYKSTLKDSYPSIWHTKQMIRRLLQERDIIVYCDLHGHSRKQNVFLYGCENRHNAERRLRERIFPAMLSKNATDKFHFGSCKFKIQKSKEGTGRIVMWNMGIMNSYTMEATFCGSTLGKNKNCHYSVADYESLGYHFCDTLLDYCDPDTTKLEENLKIEIRDRMARHGIMAPADVDLADYYSSDIESSDGGSDSSVSDGPPIHLQYTASRSPKKKKKLKTKKERDRAHSLKDDQKKQPQNERPSSEQPTSEKKPMSGHQTSHARQEKNEYLEALTTAYLRNGVLYDESGGKFQGKVVGNSFVRVWKDFLQRQRLHPNPQGNMEELALAQMGQRPGISPIDRRPFPRHLIEVSAAQQRQQEIQMKKDKSTLKSHPIPFDDRDKPASSSRIRTQIPSATFVNYKTFKISQMSISPGMEGSELKTDVGQSEGNNMDMEENAKIVEEEPRRDSSHHSNQGHHKHRSGRVSRREMRYSDEEEDGEEEEDGCRAKGPDYVKDPHASRQPRVKSAKGAEETNSAIQSILELKKSLASSALQSNLSPTTGNYINKLLKQETKLKEEVEHTGQEIKKLTTKLQHEIEEKQRQYDSMVDRQNSTSRKGSASDKAVTAKTEDSSTDRNTKSSDPTDGNNIPRTEIDKHNCKKEDDDQTKMFDVKVPPSSASTARSETSIDTAVEKSTKFYSSVLKNDLSDPSKPEKHYQTIVKPVNKSNNSTANSLGGDPSSNRVRAKPSGVTNGSSQGPIMLLREQSASSGSSKDDNTERSKTSTGIENKSETFRTESTTRVKSAKNSSSRQIVETVPTKISLMITKDHEDKVNLAGQFLPLSRTVKGPFAKLVKKKQ
ncbi:hypothetical protein CHS0354_040690 [Potamilus streckersoni]|uniref:Peptidase M14 domain-containing protein n=1 Tax=Potamilus streckersoni TaxID=2493646 RepID=A0AAE0VYJ8_9BIVA|nr:hypothetical protein CHS0354_040690 [Potamilus streckersoni]